MLLSTWRTPREEEEEERARGGVAMPKRVDLGGAEAKGTSLEMIGAIGNWGLRSVILWSFKNSISETTSIIILICGAYPQLRSVVLEILIIS
jgi:hypothetical protein